MRAFIALVVVCMATGCYHDKYNVNGPKVEDYQLPPNEARYTEPDKATYRAPPAPKKEENLKDRGKAGPSGLGGL